MKLGIWPPQVIDTTRVRKYGRANTPYTPARDPIIHDLGIEIQASGVLRFRELYVAAVSRRKQHRIDLQKLDSLEAKKVRICNANMCI